MAKNYYQLDENTRITTDNFGWHLESPVNNKKKGIIWVQYSHFSNFKSCINSFAEEVVRKHWADIKKIEKKLDELKSKVEDIEKCFIIY